VVHHSLVRNRSWYELSNEWNARCEFKAGEHQCR
jgi:hypothetical protein